MQREGCPAVATSVAKADIPLLPTTRELRLGRASEPIRGRLTRPTLGFGNRVHRRATVLQFLLISPMRSLCFLGKRGRPLLARSRCVFTEGRFVYVIRSLADPTRYYVGKTIDVTRRLAVHNSGGSQHTAALRPWELVAAIEFTKESSAAAFEKYLKSGSGRAFAKRHFV